MTTTMSSEEDLISVEREAPRKGKQAPLVTLDSAVFADVDVSLTVILGRGTMSVQQLLKLAEGDVVDLNTPLDGTVDITLNDRLVAQGEIVAVDDHFGVRITKIVASAR